MIQSDYYYLILFIVQLDFNYTDKIFIVAVSGGVDSVALLHTLVNQHSSNRYIVANINHGIRQDVSKDADLVRSYAEEYHLPFEYTELKLGSAASEAQARAARYLFLQTIMKKHEAHAIITAHHQDDVIETMFINIVRGTGRRGLSSLKSNNNLVRPLLEVSKAEIYSYARQHDLTWREDSTNSDMKYLRNMLRHRVVAKMNSEQRAQALTIVNNASRINYLLDRELAQLLRRGLHKGELVVNRGWFAQLPHDVSLEVLYLLLSSNEAPDINKMTLERTVVAIKTLRPGKTIQLSGGEILLTKRSARIKIHRKTEGYTV